MDGDSLMFRWTFVSAPAGSGAQLSDATSVKPIFTADVAGTYVVQLIVSDGKVDSEPKTVTIIVGPGNVVPTANAGPDQKVTVGDTVQLDGSKSSDLDGDALSFAWSFRSRPAGSTAVLSDPTSVSPTFTADLEGVYTVELTVSDGQATSAPDLVSITAGPSETAPVADAGPDQSITAGDTVQLDGSGSKDLDGDSLTLTWSFVTVPTGSTATLSDRTATKPTFVADLVGLYVVQLIVNDGTLNSSADTVTVTAGPGNTLPTANAGADQGVTAGDTVQLDGGGSTDVDGDSLTYAWSLTSRPPGSTAALSDPTAVKPTFVADLGGTYVAQLIVNDGKGKSQPDFVTIVAGPKNLPPIADAGPDRTVKVGDAVQLDGSGSKDPNGDPITYRWSFISRPPDSGATLSDSTVVNPTFVVDKGGAYTIQLIVNDGKVDSIADSVTVTATGGNTRPVADAGLDQTVGIGATVHLDGSGSNDPENNPLTYTWSLVSRPAGSAAALSDPSVVNPAFVADVAGVYVVQLIVNDGELDSLPDTVTITAQQGFISCGQTVRGTITNLGEQDVYRFSASSGDVVVIRGCGRTVQRGGSPSCLTPSGAPVGYPRRINWPHSALSDNRNVHCCCSQHQPVGAGRLHLRHEPAVHPGTVWRRTVHVDRPLSGIDR